MCMTLYIGSQHIKDKSSLVALNDAWFNNHLQEIRFNKTEQKIIKSIDGVEYVDNGKFKSKFNSGTLIDASELSTGCKTALNIYTFKDKIFNLAECGDNALQVILYMKQGKCYTDFKFIPDDFKNTIEVMYKGGKTVIKDNFELDDIMEVL